MNRTEQGFSHVIAIFVIALVIGMGFFVGYRISQLDKTNEIAATEAGQLSTEQQAKVDATPQLKEANTELTNVANDLSSDLDMSVLDEDIDALY